MFNPIGILPPWRLKMNDRATKTRRILGATAQLILLLSVLSGMPALAQIAGFGTIDSDKKIDIGSLSESELESYMATLTDKESRELLLERLRAEAQEEESVMPEEAFGSSMIMTLQNRSEEVETQFKKIVRAAREIQPSLSRTVSILFNVDGVDSIPRTLSVLIVLLLLGLAAVWLVFRLLRDFRSRLREPGEFTVATSLSRIGMVLVHDLLRVALFMGITILLTFVFFDRQDPVRSLASTIVIFIASVWAVKIILTELLYSPMAKNLFFSSNADRKIYYWSALGFFIPSFLSLYSIGLLSLLGFPSELVRLNGILLATLALGSLITGMLLYAKIHSARMESISENDPQRSHQINWYWPFALIFVFLWIWIVVLHNIITIQAWPGGLYNYFAVLLIMFSPLYDRLIQLLMSPNVILVDRERQPEDELLMQIQEPQLQPLASNQFVRIFFAIPYAALTVLCLLEGMGFGVLSTLGDGSAASFWRSVFEVILAIFVGAVFWNAIKSYINKKLPAISLDPEALMDSEGGGSDIATRTQTLLPIIRNFFLFLILLLVSLIVLSSLGVNTAPLLAGAGVVGIAIGFGAQKLVQDIVSGMFFLVEDAFRIGEYIESGDMVGTVESTSIRSLKLRHHLGPVQTVPYSEIRSVKNHSRDFIIMKLKFRVPFDTDIEVVRKTIKKVGQELLKHEELGPDFIAPLKSQGVLHVEDDALMMRMKFTSKPGKQWLIRREAYRRVKEALEAKGINFAQRQVMVQISGNHAQDEQLQQEIAGAATEMSESQQVKDKPAGPMADM